MYHTHCAHIPMPTTTSLGDRVRSSAPPAATSRTLSVSVPDEEVVYPSQYERLVSAAACLLLVACGIGIGVWASL